MFNNVLNKNDLIINDFSEAIEQVSFPLIVILENTSDYPNKFLARLWDIGTEPALNKATEFIILADTLDEIRQSIPNNMQKFVRSEDDDIVIIESYM